ncbi:MAG: hypothetical protein ACI4QV_02110 [Acutalibacteraceae bacterium]
MTEFVELPIVKPLYSTYQYQGTGCAVIHDNPTVKNWYLNHSVNLRCEHRFISGYTSPEIKIVNSSWRDNPCLIKLPTSMRFLDGYIHRVIRSMLNEGYYVTFTGIDDYYLKGKSFYKERHYDHDGLIYGYDQRDKTYSMFSYNSNWIYAKFKTPQRSFDNGRKAMFKNGRYGMLYALKPKPDTVEISCEEIYKNLLEYLDSSTDKYPYDGEGAVFGIAVHDYIILYLEMLKNGKIPYEKMDWRIMRLIWEHKCVMLERIAAVENKLEIGAEISEKYAEIADAANTVRMLYASYRMKRRDSELSFIQKKLREIKTTEQLLLTALLQKMGDAMGK